MQCERDKLSILHIMTFNSHRKNVARKDLSMHQIAREGIIGAKYMIAHRDAH
jgi:hypothetical protein